MCDLVFSCFVVLDQGLKHAGCMWPTRFFGRPAMLFGNFQIINIYIVDVIVSSPLFKVFD